MGLLSFFTRWWMAHNRLRLEKGQKTRFRTVLQCVLTVCFLFVTPVNAEQKKGLKGSPESSRAMYGETQITYRNTVSARSFNRSADLTYNPYYAMELDIALAFRASKQILLLLDTAFGREITNSDETTKRGEIRVADVFLEVVLPYLKPIPVLKVDVVPSVKLYVPTGKVSQARTLILGVRPELVLSKRLDVLSGLSISYGFWIRKDFHEYTTAATETPLIDNPMGSTRSVDSFSNTGSRNVSFAISNSLGLAVYFTEYVGVKISCAFRHGFLYDIETNDPRVSYEPQDETDVRYQMMYQGEIFGQIGKAWILALGFLTENYQLAQDSTYEAPFFNRYTALYLDVRLDLAGLVSQLSSKRGKK